MIVTYTAYQMIISQLGKPMAQLTLNDVNLFFVLHVTMQIALQLPG